MVCALIHFFCSEDSETVKSVPFEEIERTLRRTRDIVLPKSLETITEIENAFKDVKIMEKFGMCLKNKDENGEEGDENQTFYMGTVKSGRFCTVIFGSPGVIGLIKAHIPSNRRNYMLDRTFKIVPMGAFTQLLIIYIAYVNKVYPFIFALMSSKSTNSYDALFEHIDAFIFNLEPASFMCDYETAMRKSISKIYPNARVSGCHFHFAQAVRRKCRSLKKKFNTVLADNNDVLNIYRKLLLLPLLPQSMISDAFKGLVSASRELKCFDYLKHILTYYKKQWVSKKVNGFDL